MCCARISAGAAATIRCRKCNMLISTPISRATSSPRLTAPVWPARSKCASRCSTTRWSSGPARLPSGLKLRGREGKHVFKAALEPYVAKDILYRPKQGFAVPLAQWFRGPLRPRLRDTLFGPVLRGSGLFDMDTLARLFDQHQSGDRDHSAVLWTLSMMEAFLRQVDSGGRSEAAPQPAEVIA